MGGDGLHRQASKLGGVSRSSGRDRFQALRHGSLGNHLRYNYCGQIAEPKHKTGPRYFRLWHLADIPGHSTDVRFRE
jgi:hypothetical protein